MRFNSKLLRASEEYPLAGRTVSGLTVGSEISNTSSIGATLDDYRILDGIREIPLKEFASDPYKLFYAANDIRRCKELAETIKHSGRIDPLIVVTETDGPYILEGAHRLGALHILGATTLPALVVEEFAN